MPTFDLIRHRLYNQHLLGPKFETPAEVVAHLGAVQSQDYAGAKWAVAQRTNGLTDADLDRAFADGSILRTHLMRPTWHFVTPADIRWLLALTAPRVHALNAYMYRKVGLDAALFKRSQAVFIKALRDRRQLTRPELAAALEAAGIATGGEQRLTYIVMQAELDGLICSGGRRGKQFTYALLAERVPDAKTLSRDEALAELTQRYFTSHGPATAHDFAWWSGLTLADAKRGLDLVNGQLARIEIDDRTYWSSMTSLPARATAGTAHLLPNYDEYGSYQDRSAIFDAVHASQLIFSHLIAIKGWIVGTWKRTLNKEAVVIESNTFRPLAPAEQRAVLKAAEQFGAFLGLPVIWTP